MIDITKIPEDNLDKKIVSTLRSFVVYIDGTHLEFKLKCVRVINEN